MYSILLAIIYLAFISLGLPDSILGAAWPSMQPSLGVPVSYAGGISVIIAGGTIISSLFSNYFIHKLGTGKVTAISVLMTAVLIFTLPLWREKSDRAETEEEKQKPLSLPEVIRLPGAKNVLVGFFCYCSLEATAGLWASSYMVLNRGISAETAAKCASLFILNNTRSMNP